MSGVVWNLSGLEIEQESFRRIEEEAGEHGLPEDQWRVARRLIHTTTDFSITRGLHFAGDPAAVALDALRAGVPIYCDSNMIKSGLSVAKLQKLNAIYTRDSIHCYVADRDVAESATQNHTTRALAAVQKAKPMLSGAIVLIGNAPLALAKIAELIQTEDLAPRLVIGMPVGFVNVTESKKMIMETSVPQIVLKGRRGGSPLAVATLHALIEQEVA